MADVREEKRMNPALRVLITLLVLLLGAAAVVLLLFRVDELMINGNRRVTSEEIQSLIRYDECHGNSLMLWLMNREVDVSSNDLLQSVEVRLEDPRTVNVRVEEQLLVGGVQNGSKYVYFNENGLILLETEAADDKLPLMEGLTVEGAEFGDYIKVADEDMLEDMLEIALILEESEVQAEKIGLAEDGRYMLTMGNVRVQLGRNIYMSEKISELKGLLPELEGLSGVLHLEEYDATKDSIIFRKDS